ncbi:MAG: pilus assembly protein PilP [Legionellales bacterium]|nr:pilus assembly protein PilP [Legionellales bacterium]
MIWLKGCLPLFFLSSLIGCSASDDTDLDHYILMVKARSANPIEPIPELKPLPTFLYPEADIRRSPFKPRTVTTKADTFVPNIKRQKQPLESFPLDALKFVGILEQGSTLWALIKEPGGLVTRARTGDYMGQNYGQIIKITEKIIHVDEAVRVGGKWEKKSIVVNLSVPD